MVATVAAGCGPVRIATIEQGNIVLVTARESDELLAFSAAGIRAGSAHALVAAVRVGEAPVGLTPAVGGTLVAVADSNRFYARGARAALTIVNTADMLAGRPSVVGQLTAGGFPRDVAVSSDGRTLFVADFDSSQMQVVDLSGLH